MARVTANRAPNLSIALQRPQFCATAPRCADLSAKRQYSTSSPKERVAVIGSGNWGTTVSKIIGENVAKNPSIFEEEVRVWVHEETVGGRKLSEVINEASLQRTIAFFPDFNSSVFEQTKTNPKYLPGIPLPRNLTADPNLASAVRGATALVFVLPHEFLASTCLAIRETLNNEPTKGKVKAVSLIKGLVTSDRFELPSQYISRTLSRDPQHLVPVSVLSGANISSEIAKEQFTESTLGYSTLSSPFNPLWTRLFTTPYFRVQAVNDIAGVELCGALKNIVALAAGFAAGLGAGSNTRATVIRLGMVEMKRFADAYFGGMDNATLLESCGVAVGVLDGRDEEQDVRR